MKFETIHAVNNELRDVVNKYTNEVCRVLKENHLSLETLRNLESMSKFLDEESARQWDEKEKVDNG